MGILGFSKGAGLENVHCIYCGASIGEEDTQERFEGMLDSSGGYDAQRYYEVHTALCVLAVAKMSKVVTQEQIVELVEDVYCEIDKIYEWSITASDFICDLKRVIERTGVLDLSRRQVLYLCKLHMIFCEENSSRSAEIEAQYKRITELED